MKLPDLNPKIIKIMNIAALVVVIGFVVWKVTAWIAKPRGSEIGEVKTENIVEVEAEDYSDYVTVEEVAMDTVVSSTDLSSALERIKGESGNVVFYTDDPYIWYGSKEKEGYSRHLSVYDADTGQTSEVSLNKTNGFSDNEMTVTDIAENDGRITVINEEMRNSNGWVEGTGVWTIDCQTREWYPVAKGISGAKFRKGGKEVVLNHAECTNPWAMTIAEREYKRYDTPVNLELLPASKADASLIEQVYKKFVFGSDEDNASRYFTSNALRKLQKDYDYDCYDGPCYGFWVLGSGGNDSPEPGMNYVTSINRDAGGWYQVTYIDGGMFGIKRFKLSGGKIDDYK